MIIYLMHLYGWTMASLYVKRNGHRYAFVLHGIVQSLHDFYLEGEEYIAYIYIYIYIYICGRILGVI